MQKMFEKYSVLQWKFSGKVILWMKRFSLLSHDTKLD